MLLGRVVDRDLKTSEAPDAIRHLAELININRKNRSHRAFRASLVGLAAGVQETERLIEVERPDLNQVVVLAQTEAERVIRPDRNIMQVLALNVVGKENAD